MLKEFLAEAAAIETALRAGTEFPDYVTDPVADGEKTIGVISDPWLQALFLAYKARGEAVAKEPRPTFELPTEADGGFMGAISRATSKLKALIQKRAEIGFLNQIIWAETAVSVGVSPSDNIGIRAGWTIVALPEAQDGLREYTERRQQPEVAFVGNGSDLAETVHPNYQPVSVS